jgi:hypothetical protein
MRPIRITASGLLTVGLMAACGEGNAPIGVPGTSHPQYSFMNNPDNGNPRIVRFGDVFAYLLIDPSTDRFSVQASTNRQFGCNESPDLISLMEAQEIWHNVEDPAAGQLNQLVLGRGIYIAVFEGWESWLASGEDCADLFARKLADGIGNLTYTDNDFFSFLRETQNANAFGFSAQGKLNLVAGGSAHYNGMSKCVGNASHAQCVDRINLR